MRAAGSTRATLRSSVRQGDLAARASTSSCPGQAQSVRPKSERFASRGVGTFDMVAAYAASIWRPVQDGRGRKPCLSVWSTVAGCRFTREPRGSNDRARRLVTQDAMAPTSQQRCMHQNRRPHSHRPSTLELSFRARVLVAVKIEEEATMGRGLLLWLIGIPIPIILLIWLFGGLHG